MYNIKREQCPDRERTWLININGHTFGIVEVVHMTETLRSIVGEFNAVTKDGFKPINVSYDCNKAKHRISYSINNFIEDIKEAIQDKEIHIPRTMTDDEPEQLYVQADVTESNAEEIARVLRIDLPFGWESQTPFQKAGYVSTYLREEREMNMACPMRDLVQKAKLAKTRATPVHMHSDW